MSFVGTRKWYPSASPFSGGRKPRGRLAAKPLGPNRIGQIPEPIHPLNHPLFRLGVQGPWFPTIPCLKKQEKTLTKKKRKAWNPKKKNWTKKKKKSPPPQKKKKGACGSSFPPVANLYKTNTRPKLTKSPRNLVSSLRNCLVLALDDEISTKCRVDFCWSLSSLSRICYPPWN